MYLNLLGSWWAYFHQTESLQPQISSGAHSDFFRCTSRFLQVHIPISSGAHSDFLGCTFRFFQVHIQMFLGSHPDIFRCTFSLQMHIKMFSGSHPDVFRCIYPAHSSTRALDWQQTPKDLLITEILSTVKKTKPVFLSSRV